MLIIRAAQMAVLAADARLRFVEELIRSLSRSFPAESNLSDRVLSTVKRARLYGFTASDDVEWFVNLDFARGHEWETMPDMDRSFEILDNADVDPAGRRFRLEKWLRKCDGHA